MSIAWQTFSMPIFTLETFWQESGMPRIILSEEFTLIFNQRTLTSLFYSSFKMTERVACGWLTILSCSRTPRHDERAVCRLMAWKRNTKNWKHFYIFISAGFAVQARKTYPFSVFKIIEILTSSPMNFGGGRCSKYFIQSWNIWTRKKSPHG